MLQSTREYMERFRGALAECLYEANAARQRERQTTEWRDMRFSILARGRGLHATQAEFIQMIPELSHGK